MWASEECVGCAGYRRAELMGGSAFSAERALVGASA